MKLYIGADHNGFLLKNHLEEYLFRSGYDVTDVSGDVLKPTDDYPQVAAQVVTAMRGSDDNDARGILICGSGQGVCIAANRFKGIRASVCADPVAVRAGRNDDDTNVLCLPSRTLSDATAEALVELWIVTAFAGAARYKRRIRELDELTGHS